MKFKSKWKFHTKFQKPQNQVDYTATLPEIHHFYHSDLLRVATIWRETIKAIEHDLKFHNHVIQQFQIEFTELKTKFESILMTKSQTKIINGKEYDFFEFQRGSDPFSAFYEQVRHLNVRLNSIELSLHHYEPPSNTFDNILVLCLKVSRTEMCAFRMSRLRCVCWNRTWNVCAETVPEMRVLKLYLKCFRWNCTWNVCATP